MKKTKPVLLEFCNVTVLKERKRRILDSVSFRIHEGESVAILGPNGAGKSSLIKVMTREYYPLASGRKASFRIWGEERWNVQELRKMVGIVSRDLQYVCTREMTGWEAILSGFFSSIGLFKEQITPAMRKKTKKIMEFLEIGHLRDRSMDRMSTGEARRFLIGRALVHDPRVLFLDEPTAGLDLHALYKVTDLLRKIARSGISVVLATQTLADIIPEIGRVILMKQGRIFHDGPKAAILTGTHISRLFNVPVDIKEKDGYYYALRG